MAEKIFSIHQPDFLPWMGLFHKIRCSDTVIIFDSVQISSGKSWSSRVKILLNGKEHWLTMPIKRSGRFSQKIYKVEMVDFHESWTSILATLNQAYLRAKYFREVYPFLTDFLSGNYVLLAQFNQAFIENTARLLGYSDIQFVKSSGKKELLQSNSTQTDYIIETCKAFGVNRYLSGVGCLDFLEIEKFKINNIEIIFQKFQHPLYNQISAAEFIPGLSILDVLFNTGFAGTKRLIEDSQDRDDS